MYEILLERNAERDLKKLSKDMFDRVVLGIKSLAQYTTKRFPEDFMFELTKEEFDNWRSQFVTSNRDRMGLRHRPMAFTEQGFAMLSSVLNSERAIQVNILIMRAFTRLQEMLETHEDLKRKLEALERKYDEQFRVVFEAIHQLMTPPDPPRKKIGFEVKEAGAGYGKGKRKG